MQHKKAADEINRKIIFILSINYIFYELFNDNVLVIPSFYSVECKTINEWANYLERIQKYS